MVLEAAVKAPYALPSRNAIAPPSPTRCACSMGALGAGTSTPRPPAADPGLIARGSNLVGDTANDALTRRQPKA